MEEYVIKDGKRLRLGYTTGSCAAAAAKAAAYMLLSHHRKESISLVTPKGISLTLPVEAIRMEDSCVTCAIRKDSGDDPDVTHGTLIFATVSKTSGSGVYIDGGTGIGRVTKPGLDQKVGSAAINSVPRRMIQENVAEVMALFDCRDGLRVIISAPEGEQLARKTFNPRLGIVGGISILGTSGIVEPMSEQALVETIRVELRQRRESGASSVILTPGNYGSDFIRDSLGLKQAQFVQVSNFIGDAIDICRELGFQGAVLIGHIGKLVKLGGGMMNTHSKYGDCRMEILAAQAGAQGLSPEKLGKMLECVSCDEGLRILQEAGLLEKTMERLTQRVLFHLQYRAGAELEMGCVLFSREYGLLGKSHNSDALIQQILEE